MPNHKLKQCWLNYWHLGTNFSEIRIKIQNISFKKTDSKIPSAKLQPFWLDQTVTTALSRPAMLSLQYMNLKASSWLQQVPYRCRIYLSRDRGPMRRSATFLEKPCLMSSRPFVVSSRALRWCTSSNPCIAWMKSYDHIIMVDQYRKYLRDR